MRILCGCNSFVWVLLLLMASCASSLAAVLYYSEEYLVEQDVGFVELDFNNDSINDLRLEVSWETLEANDGAFVASPLGTSRIASLTGISQSFSAGDVVLLDQLNLLGSPNTVLTGGVLFDAFGNVAWEGWGGCVYDIFGNAICPDGGPTHQIDFFLMEFGDGVAWVDLDVSLLAFGELGVDWAYLPNADNTIRITQIPEPNSFVLSSLSGLCWILQRRRRNN